MYLVINGDLNKYYMQTLCMLFFPGATFSEDENDAALQQAGIHSRDLRSSAPVLGDR